MMMPGQPPFKRGEGDEAQWAEAGKRSFCYAGPYYISNEGSGREEVLRHTFQVCNLPGWLGDVQIRTWSFEEDDELLVLGSEGTTEVQVYAATFQHTYHVRILMLVGSRVIKGYLYSNGEELAQTPTAVPRRLHLKSKSAGLASLNGPTILCVEFHAFIFASSSLDQGAFMKM